MPEKVATAVTYTASGTSVIAGLTLNEWAAAVGIVVAVLTFGVNFFFQWDRRRREIESKSRRRK